MHIVVCVKQVPDPDAPFSQFKVDELAKKVIPASGLKLVMSPFDEQAVEAALRIRESAGATKITALGVGSDSARSVLKHALAMGADEAVLVSDDALVDANGEVTGLALARAITQLEPVDLVLTGRQAADTDAGIVGCAVAERLGLPLVSFAKKIEVADRVLRVERVLADGTETVEGPLPAVVTVSNELGAARAPSLRETMRAARKPLAVRSAADIGVTADEVREKAMRSVRARLFVPVKDLRCELMPEGDVSVQASALAHRLREARLI